MNGFENIVVVGVGLIGGSLGLALKQKGYKGKIVGVSRAPTLEAALDLGVIDEGYPYEELSSVLQGADLVYLCTPIFRIEQLLGQIGAMGMQLKKDCVITDVGSAKQHICQVAAEKLPAHLPFVGGHPMAGSEQSGVEAADPFLFENAIYVLTPGANVPADIGHRLAAFTQRLGAKVLLLDPATHDRIASVVSHVPQLLSVALMNWAAQFARQESMALQLAAGGFRDMTRIASSPFHMWKDVLEANQIEIERRLDEFIAELKSLKLDLQTGKLENRFNGAQSSRNIIPKDTKGFLRPLHEILVISDDKPGVIANISMALSQKGINIKDIEVLKVREGEGGTLRLAVESRQAAVSAVEILQASGLGARIRE